MINRTFRVVCLVVCLAVTATACSNEPDDEVLVVPSAAPSSTVAVVPVTQAQPAATTDGLFAVEAPAATDECPVGLLDTNSSVSTVGLDEVLFGMTINQASTAASVCLVAEAEVVGDCQYVRPVGGPDGIGFMVTNGTIERVDIIAGTITTRSGAGIGSTEQQINDLFPGKIETTPSPSGVGNLLAFIPSDADDQQFRVIWETNDAGEVVAFRSGRRPQVEQANGCQS